MAGRNPKAASPAKANSTTKGAQKGQGKAKVEDVLVVDTAPGIFVRSFNDTFRRAGLVFTSEGHGLLLSDLTEAQLKALEEEPMLSVQFCDFPATEEADAQLAELADSAKEVATGTAPAAPSGTEPPPGGNA